MTTTEWAADARIPDAIWYAGWRQAARTLTVGGRTVTAPDSAAGMVALMALVMTERSAGDGACTEADLAAAGFTSAEIASLADRARGLARHTTADRDGIAGALLHRVTRLRPQRLVVRVRAAQVRS